MRRAAQNNARPLAPPAGARARSIQPRSIWPANFPDVQPLQRMTGPGSPHRPHGPLNRSKPPVPLAELVTTLACAIDERSSRSAIHSSQSGVPSILRTSPDTCSAMVGRLVIMLR